MGKKFLAVLLLGVFSTNVVQMKLNNVCKTYGDYLTKNTNKNCWYNPDVNSNMVDMVRRNGYPLEIFDVVTEDGYILTLHRIPHSRKNECSCRQPIFLMHGFLTVSETWVNFRNRSMAFFLADHCFDVWMGNYRGTPHSQKHLKFTTKDDQFWNFSFHEMGYYDIPAFFDFIYRKTGGKKVIYLGHSMGTSISYVYAILRGEDAKKHLAGIISMAPCAYLAHFKASVVALVPFWRQLWDFDRIFRLYGVFQSYSTTQIFESLTCEQIYLMPLCILVLMSISGNEQNRLSPEDAPVLFSYFPMAGSTKTMIHFSQDVDEGGRFQYFDYQAQNIFVYGRTTPPQYRVENIAVPVHLLYGSEDVIAPEQDVYYLYNKIKTEKSIKKFKYTHIDFILANNLLEYLYPTILKITRHLSQQNNCTAR